MDRKYIKTLNINIIFYQNRDDNKKRHEFESLTINRDATSSNVKTGLDSIRNLKI